VSVVTGLREQPRGRVEVALDGAPWRLVPADAVVRAGLSVGTVVDRETARRLGRELRRAEALTRAARVLKHGDRSRRALADRLEGAGVDASARESALDALERVGAVDDVRLAANRASHLAEKGHGDAAIRFDLEGKGLGADRVEEALAGLEPERERAQRLVDLRGRGQKTARWLSSRGFDPEIVGELAVGFADGA
jgi:SOS response regulatory protein OraA/RecX